MSTITLSRIKITLLKRALKSTDGIFVGEITAKMGISIKDAVAAFRTLRRLGFLKQQSSALRLTSKGRSWIMENQNMFAFTGEKTWRRVPDHYRSNTIRPVEPYAPRLTKLSKKAFGVGLSGKN
jgi:hypothetical protein